MAKLPRYNASVSPSRSPGMVRATDFSTLTNTGEQAALAKASQAVQIKAGGQQAIAGGMANIGGMLRDIGNAAYQLEVKRRDVETRTLNTKFAVAYENELENMRIEAEQSEPRFGEERTELTKTALKKIAKFREQQRKEVELTKNKPLMNLFDLQTPGNELLAKTTLRREYTKQLDSWLTVSAEDSTKAYIDNGQYEEARVTMGSLVEGGMRSKEYAEEFLESNILRKESLDVLYESGITKAEEFVMDNDSVETDNKKKIISDIIFNSKVSERAFKDRQGEGTERLAKMLNAGTLTEDGIDAVDLQAVGAQKQDAFEWKQEWKSILRETNKLSEPVASEESVYDRLLVGSQLVERGSKSPAEWEQEFVKAWADGKLSKEDRRALRVKDIVATSAMQNRAFSEATSNTMPRLVEMRDDELAGLIAARDNAVRLKDLKTVSALNFSIKKAQIQKWNFGRFRQELRTQLSQNEAWSQKQIFVAEDILADQFDKPIADLMLEFENANPQESILSTPPHEELKDIWDDLSQEDKAAAWELIMRGASVGELIGASPE